MANTRAAERDKNWVMRPWLLDTYRDLFRDVGYALESEERPCSRKVTVDYDALVLLFHK